MRVRHAIAAAFGARWDGDLRRQACAVAFEPNPRFTPTLVEMRARAGARLRSVELLTETAAVGTRGSAVAFFQLARRDPSAESSVVHTATPHGKDRSSTTAVRAINFVDWLRNASQVPRYRDVPIIVRLDIEGGEYPVLQDLVTSGLASTLGHRLYLAVEWHTHHKKSWPELEVLSKIDGAFAGRACRSRVPRWRTSARVCHVGALP